jgi:N-acetylglucosamine kinase-like BadF-type ATPase
MMKYYLGIDIGGSKSHALIADQNGRVTGWGQGGSGNHESVGMDGLRQVLQEVTQQAVASAGIQPAQIAGAGFGMAGYDWPFQRPMMMEVIESLGLTAPFELVNDTLITLLAGASQGWGVAVVAGTSNNCRGWRPNRTEGRMVGHGAWMGEYGGADELVLKAVHAVAADWSRRGPATRLSEIFPGLVGARDLTDFIEGLAVGRILLSGETAPLIFEVAEEGDAVAKELIRWTGTELGSLAIGVIRQLDFGSLEFDLVLGGSIFKGSPVVMQAVADTVLPEAPGARLIRLSVPPVVGGVLLGMEQDGLYAGECRENLVQSFQELLINA